VGREFRWTSRACSHAGRVRERNEDACLDRPERGLWAVADGIGGASGGDVASAMIVDALGGVAPPKNLERFVADTRARLEGVNRRLRAAGARKAERIGSTVAVLLAWGRHCGFLWAGDSRIYRLRNGRLRQLTRDHSELEALRARGVVTEGEALDHPARSRITRAVGVVDSLELEERCVEVVDGDVFLLCSDGLSNELNAEEIAGALLPGNCGKASSALIGMALERGGRDNVSAVVVRAEEIDGDRTLCNPAF
jgi:protein phosphatase